MKRGILYWIPVVLISLGVIYLAFFSTPVENKKRTTTRLMMGTLVAITTWDVPDQIERDGVVAAFQEMDRIEKMMSRHLPNSPLSQINRADLGKSIPLPQELAEIIQLAIEIEKKTDGAFNQGLGKLVTLWGFSGDSPPNAPPFEEKILAWRKQFHASDAIQLSEQNSNQAAQITRINTAVALDLGGIAKGYAIDRSIAVLKAHGIHHALVNAGGDLRVIGRKGDQPWRVGIQHPRDPNRVIATSDWPAEDNNDLSMVTSGDYERFFLHQERRYHHILDPKSGYPAESGLLSVSVQAQNATLADALSTAFFVLGEERTQSILSRFKGIEILLVRQDLSHWMSPGFKGLWQGEKIP